MSLKDYLNESATVIQQAASNEDLLNALNEAISLIIETLSKGLPVLVCGNGGLRAMLCI
jgi:phosphoheptose isomerase